MDTLQTTTKYCVKVGVSATTQSMFDKLNEFFEKYDLDWIKCTSAITNGAAAMQGSTNEFAQKIKKFYRITFQIIV